MTTPETPPLDRKNITEEEFVAVKLRLLGYAQAQRAGFRPKAFTYMTALDWLDQASILFSGDSLIELSEETPFGFRSTETGLPIWIIQQDEDNPNE